MTMKQRITVEQLDELTAEQRVNLQEWWKPQKGDMLYYPFRRLVLLIEEVSDKRIESIGDLLQKDMCYPLLSIGQMIELIRSKCNRVAITTYNDEWGIVASSGDPISTNIDEELCDALWRVVKKIL